MGFFWSAAVSVVLKWGSFLAKARGPSSTGCVVLRRVGFRDCRRHHDRDGQPASMKLSARLLDKIFVGRLPSWAMVRISGMESFSVITYLGPMG
jgi:hypothetical protein